VNQHIIGRVDRDDGVRFYPANGKLVEGLENADVEGKSFLSIVCSKEALMNALCPGNMALRVSSTKTVQNRTPPFK
jgi:hypothetical protein